MQPTKHPFHNRTPARRGHHEQAALFFAEAARLRPSEARTLFKLGNAHFGCQSYGPAEAAYEAALQVRAAPCLCA